MVKTEELYQWSFCACLFWISTDQLYLPNHSQTTYFYTFKQFVLFDWFAVQEPSLFAVAKLLETGLVNMDRIQILWRPLTGHLLEVKSV